MATAASTAGHTIWRIIILYIHHTGYIHVLKLPNTALLIRSVYGACPMTTCLRHSPPRTALPDVHTAHGHVIKKTPNQPSTHNTTMIYGYIRVSTDKQTVENQRYEIEKYCTARELCVDRWIEETVSGTKTYKQRSLGTVIKRLNCNDTLICTEMSRLGRSLFMIMEILSQCLKKGCRVYTIKDNYQLGDNIESKVLAFAFGLSAEIERTLISQRTREALARLKKEGRQLGRPKGAKGKSPKLQDKDAQMQELRNKHNVSETCKILRISRSTYYRWKS